MVDVSSLSLENTKKIKYLFINTDSLTREGTSLPLSPTVLNQTFFKLREKLGYLLKYIKGFGFSFSFSQKEISNNLLNEDIVKRYLEIALANSFLWKDLTNFVFFFHNFNSLWKCSPKKYFSQWKDISILEIRIHPLNLRFWKKPIVELKEILVNLGLNLSLRLVSNQDNEDIFFFQKKKKSLLQKFEDKKIYELGIHTRFSCLDGISSPENFVNSALEKGYAAIAVTDHYNVQSFPKFFSKRDQELKIIYGCELEMIEEDPPLFIINHQNLDENKELDEITYCFFDLETTGLFSEYNEIIEVGYLIYRKGQIVEEGDFLIRPEKPFSQEMLRNWYHKTLSPENLLKANSLEEVLEQISVKWSNCVLVAHNAINFDYGFLNKAWIEKFHHPLYFPIIDSLIVSKLVFPNKRSYSLEKLSNQINKKKDAQIHRALEDSRLLVKLFEKIIKTLKEANIKTWKEVTEEIKKKKEIYLTRGKKVKVLVQNQEGLYNLYHLVTTSHTQKLFKNPCVSRSDLIKNRSGLLIGASGSRDGEIFSLFSSFSTKKEKEKAFLFYDYIEVNSPKSFSYLYKNGYLKEQDLNELSRRIIQLSEELEIKVIPSHNVHYTEKKEKVLKDIIIANKGINGQRHYLYREATLEEKEDRFSSLPQQHLLTKEEMVEQWIFLSNTTSIENLLFHWPEELVTSIEEISIKPQPLNYNFSDIKEKEKELRNYLTKKANDLFGQDWPEFVQTRIKEEWEIIQNKYIFIFWIAWKIARKTKNDKSLIGSRGSVGCSFIAFLCDITELNPLPFYKRCPNCFYTELFQSQEPNYSCYNYQEKEECPNCSFSFLVMEGLNMPMETFFGISGEKTPDIDLNFSSEYQKIVHNYVRELLGSKSVHRIGTINTLKESIAKDFWINYLQLRKNLNSEEHLKKITDSKSEWQREYCPSSCLNSELKEKEELKKWIPEVEEKTSNNFFSFNNIQEAEKRVISEIQGVKRTSGQHPGGLLITPPDTDINLITPLNYPADKKTDFTTTHFEYEFLATILLKIDILGHDEPAVLQKLFSLTKKDPLTIPFDDEKVMNIFTSADTLGVTEFGTDFVHKILLTLKPTKFSHLVQICGFAHGTNVWQNNQQGIYSRKELELDQLIACRDDIWEFFQKEGLDRYSSFVATEFIRKGKWKQIPEAIKQKIVEQLEKSKKGKVYLSILEKIEYILPKPHSIAYTITAWRGAYYKAYFPQQFYSTLLTFHVRVFDIWLMTLNPEIIRLRLKILLETVKTYKNSAKEIVSIIKVLEKINTKNAIVGLEPVLLETYKQIEEKEKELNKRIIRNDRERFFLTQKEKDLLYSLKIILEMERKQFKYKRGISLNNSEEKVFKIEDGVIFFPLLAISGFGKKIVDNLIAYRKNETILRENWKEALSSLLNSNHLEQLLNLEKNDILIW